MQLARVAVFTLLILARVGKVVIAVVQHSILRQIEMPVGLEAVCSCRQLQTPVRVEVETDTTMELMRPAAMAHQE
jgi:hypothetical protein